MNDTLPAENPQICIGPADRTQPCGFCDSPPGEPCRAVTLFMCGKSRCDHDYTGWVEIDGGRGGTTVCSKCGARAIDEAMWD